LLDEVAADKSAAAEYRDDRVLHGRAFAVRKSG
jgi:hypothetical protein